MLREMRTRMEWADWTPAQFIPNGSMHHSQALALKGSARRAFVEMNETQAYIAS